VQVLASAEIIAPHARHNVILAMTLPRRPPFVRRLDAKRLGDRLQLEGCRQADPAREAILLVVTTPRISFAEQFQRSIQGTPQSTCA
jgi:hypothetical protein